MRIIIGAGWTIIAGAAGMLLASTIEGINLQDASSSAIAAIREIFMAAIPLWAILLSSLLICIAVFLCMIVTISRRRPPEWYKFTQLEYKGFLFRWGYTYTIPGRPCNYREHCPHCKCEFYENNCSYCDSPRKNIHLFGRAHNEVSRIVNTCIENGEYKKYIPTDIHHFPVFSPSQAILEKKERAK